MDKYYKRVPKSELPPGAKRLTISEVSERQWRTIRNWQPKSEVWPLIHGPGILAGTTVVTGTLVVGIYRKFFNLGRSGLLVTMGPTCIISSMASLFVHHKLVQDDLVTGQLNCATCAEVRALSLQLTFGYLYPVLVAPLVSMATAKKNLTFPLPPLTDYKAVLSLLKKASRPVYPILLLTLALQIGAVVFTVRKEGQAFAKVMEKSPLQHVR